MNFRRRLWLAWLFTGLAWLVAPHFAAAQLYSGPNASDSFAGELSSLRALETARMDPAIFPFYSVLVSPVQDPGNAVSKLDVAAPKNARKEYDKGYLLLLRKDLQGAIEHLARAISIYPNFVAAHTALGITYLNAGQTQQAHDQFARALALDDHLPGSHLNLACAQMQLQRYAEAEESMKRASSLAPLDLVVLKALTYAQFKNRNYPGVIATTRQVHRQKHAGAALVHLLAAGAWEAQDHLGEAQDELETLLNEDPKSPSSGQFRKILDQVKTEQVKHVQRKRAPADPVRSESIAQPSGNAGGAAAPQIRQASEEMAEHGQIAGANPDANTTCPGCIAGASAGPAPPSGASAAPEQADVNVAHQVIRVAVEEVAMLFAVTDHGKSVTDLRLADVKIRDDGQPPDAVLGFHNVTQLPLRIGLVIDTSNSITDRFLFEEAAASKFLETVVTDKNDLAFVVGFNCAVLLAQDFTPDKTLTARALGQLAPGGGTALWDAVGYAADKLASHPDAQPVARILVVISDGEDNSSSISLQQAMWKAQRGEVAIYTVSTKEGSKDEYDPLTGNRALKTLSEQTGGAIFASGSLGDLTKRLAELEQVLRGRYLVYYNPASHQPDGRYHAVDIRAEKDGHKLKVIARKGYYASALLDAGVQ